MGDQIVVLLNGFSIRWYFASEHTRASLSLILAIDTVCTDVRGKMSICPIMCVWNCYYQTRVSTPARDIHNIAIKKSPSKWYHRSHPIPVSVPMQMQIKRSAALKESQGSTPAHHHAAPTSSLPTSRALQLLQTSSNPPITSPQTLAHSRPTSLFSQFPFSNQQIPSSLASASRRISTTISVAERKRLVAREVVCRVMCRVSER